MTEKCEKCGYESEKNKKIEETHLCSICRHFAPEKEKLSDYVSEKVDWKTLESFRKFHQQDKNISAMRKKAKTGEVVSRAAFGYNIVNKKMIPDEEKKLIIQKIFLTFLNEEISLNKLANQFNFSVNGLKKILKNFTYIGKIKFDGQILEGKHEPIILPELFNKVQNKLDKLGIN